MIATAASSTEKIKESIIVIATAASSTDNGLPLHKLDWDGNEVELGDKVLLLTNGKYT